MNFNEFYISNNEGKSNCVVRTFCKIFSLEYDDVYQSLCSIAQKLKIDSYNDIQVFETYMKEHNIFSIEYGKGLKIKDLKLEKGSYVIFCWDKKDFYHMVSIIDKTLYDYSNESLELFALTVYKKYNN